MSLIVSEVGTFRLVEAGTYPARCIRLIDIGTQEGEYNGKKILRKQIIVTWELPTEIISDGDYVGEPYIISKFYTASLSDKANLRKDLEAWRGKAFTESELKGFHLQVILDKPCMLSIIHNETGRAKVSGMMAIPKGLEILDRINPLVSFDITNWDAEVYENLSDGIKGIIQKSKEVIESVKPSDKSSDIKIDVPNEKSNLDPF